MMDTSPRLKAILRSAFAGLGYELRALEPPPGPQLTTVGLATLVLLNEESLVNVVEIGANDGRVNDPLYPTLIAHGERTRVMLVEPQSALMPVLQANYASHPHAIFANCAVGPGGDLTLYTIDPSEWGNCEARYAQGWPAYRAPSGIASTDRSKVEAWARRHYRGARKPNDVVVADTVRSERLLDLLHDSGFGARVDVLQVDVEGFDDEVLYHSSLEVLQPRIINFEHMLLPAERLRNLEAYLRSVGYELGRSGPDTICVLSR